MRLKMEVIACVRIKWPHYKSDKLRYQFSIVLEMDFVLLLSDIQYSTKNNKNIPSGFQKYIHGRSDNCNSQAEDTRCNKDTTKSPTHSVPQISTVH